MDIKLLNLQRQSEIFVKPIRERAEAAEAEIERLRGQLYFIKEHLTTSVDTWNNKILIESTNIRNHTCKFCRAKI